MTIEEKVKEWLVGQGMPKNQAAAVFEEMKFADESEGMDGRWADSVEDYSDIVIVQLLDFAKEHALRYVDANCPRAWFRPMFV